MRLGRKELVKSHLILPIDTHDHHNQGTFFTVLINSQAIAAGADYEHRVSLGRTGYQTLRGVIRGHQTVAIRGHVGCFFLATDSQQESIGMSSAYSGYVYMGAFSRLHGDSKLSRNIFGSSVYFKDAYIDGNEAVLLFHNSYGSTRYLKCYGTVSCG